jgi:hypothetical protein
MTAIYHPPEQESNLRFWYQPSVKIVGSTPGTVSTDKRTGSRCKSPSPNSAPCDAGSAFFMTARQYSLKVQGVESNHIRITGSLFPDQQHHAKPRMKSMPPILLSTACSLPPR